MWPAPVPGRPTVRTGRRQACATREPVDGDPSGGGAADGRPSPRRLVGLVSGDGSGGVAVGRGVARKPSELPGAVHADEDLAEEPLPARRLAAGAERLDGDLGHGPGGLGRGERPALEPFRGREQAPPMDDVRIARAAGDRFERHVAARPGSGRHPRARAAATPRCRGRPRSDRRPVPRSAGSPLRPHRARRPRRPRVRPRRAGPPARHGPWPARRPRAPGRPRRPASSTARAATTRRARRWTAAKRPRGPGPRTSRGTWRPDGRDPVGVAAGRGRAGCAAAGWPACRGPRRRCRWRAPGARTDWTDRRARSRSPPRGSAGPHRAGRGPGRRRRCRVAGRSRGPAGRRPRTRPTDCARATARRPAASRGRPRRGGCRSGQARSSAGWTAGSSGGRPAAGPRGPGRRAGPSRSGR